MCRSAFAISANVLSDYFGHIVIHQFVRFIFSCNMSCTWDDMIFNFLWHVSDALCCDVAQMPAMEADTIFSFLSFPSQPLSLMLTFMLPLASAAF